MAIQHDGRHRDFTLLSNGLCPAQQPPHPEFMALSFVQPRGRFAGFFNHASTAGPMTRDNGR